MMHTMSTTDGVLCADVEMGRFEPTKQTEWNDAKDAAQCALDAYCAAYPDADLQGIEIIAAMFVTVDGYHAGVLVFTTLDIGAMPVSWQCMCI